MELTVTNNNTKVQKTLYWNDYETFGLDPQRDRPAQFAGIRTDENLNIIGDPLVLYCKPANDMLPQPESCMITGITPQKALKLGIRESEFIGGIHEELSRAGTCGVGFNSIRFDDEFTRYTLFRNFFDPYEREWKNGNSRWDIIDVARLTRALRPQGMEWPDHSDGKPSFRLEDLTLANGISHGSAHDALSDVHATIALARRIKEKQPKLYQYVWNNRNKELAARELSLFKKKPVLHVSRMYPAEKGCIAMVVPVAKHPTDKNGIIVYDLSVDPTPLLNLNEEEIHERVFTPVEQLPECVKRIPLKTVHINRCPVIVPYETLKAGHSERVKIDVSQCLIHLEAIKKAENLNIKIRKVFEGGNPCSSQEKLDDPDHSLYSGGFFSDGDKKKMEKIRSALPEEMGKLNLSFQDPRIPEMLFRYRARNYPETLSQQEKMRWESYRTIRLTSPQGGGGITINDYLTKIAELRIKQDMTADQLKILDELEIYAGWVKPILQ